MSDDQIYLYDSTLRDGAPSGVFDKLQAVDAQYGSYLLAKSAAQKSLKDRGEFTSKELITSLQSSGDAAGYGQGPLQELVMDIAEISKSADERISVLPDFIANCGMARVFAYLMEDDIEMTDKAIFEDTSSRIREALQKSYDINNSKQNISKTAMEIALKQLCNTLNG